MLAVPPSDDTQDDVALAKSLPQLLMYTAILAVKMYPSQLSSFIASTVLTRLIVRFVSMSSFNFRFDLIAYAGRLASAPTLERSHYVCGFTE